MKSFVSLVLVVGLFAFMFVNGCTSNGGMMRASPYFGMLGMPFLDPDNLGEHHYKKTGFEKIGMLYTCKAGFVDIGHVRESIDRTRYAYEICLENILCGKNEFSLRIVEPAKYVVSLDYPSNWNSLEKTEREKIAREISVCLGGYLSRTSTTWHEIITWYGYSCVTIFPEKPSSFSWEDLYSDTLGSRISCAALRNGTDDFDGRVTNYLNEALKKLDVRDSETTREAVRKIRGKWFNGSGYPAIHMMKRNFDAGFSGSITPWLVPGICDNTIPSSLSSLRLDSVGEKGFSFKVKIEPREPQSGRILNIVNQGSEGFLEPDAHFQIIVEHIRGEAKREEGPLVDVPSL